MLKRPLFMGLSLPWLLAVAVLLVGTCWYLFGPEPTPTINHLAFDDGVGQMPRQSRPSEPVQRVHNDADRTMSSASPGDSELPRFKETVAVMITGLRSDGDANRAAILRLSETAKTQSASLSELHQQLAESQAQIALLTARLALLEQTPNRVSRPAAERSTAKGSGSAPSALAGMKVEAVQNDMAWVSWQDQTWAVKAGDKVGRVTILGIDAQAREIDTSAGRLR